MTTTPDHDAYIASVPEQFQPLLHHVRTTLASVLPDADEMVAYNMPGFKFNGTVVASYAAFSRQCGMYVLPEAILEHSEAISAAGLKATKTGITFSPSKPIPDQLVKELARTSQKAATS